MPRLWNGDADEPHDVAAKHPRHTRAVGTPASVRSAQDANRYDGTFLRWQVGTASDEMGILSAMGGQDKLALNLDWAQSWLGTF